MTGRPRLSIWTKGLGSISRRNNTVTISSTIIDGPHNTRGRSVKHNLGVDDLAFLVATLAASPAWRKALRAATDEIASREVDPGNTPSTHLARALDSIQTHERLTAIMRKTVYDNYVCKYPDHEHDHEGICGG